MSRGERCTLDWVAADQIIKHLPRNKQGERLLSGRVCVGGWSETELVRGIVRRII